MLVGVDLGSFDFNLVPEVQMQYVLGTCSKRVWYILIRSLYAPICDFDEEEDQADEAKFKVKLWSMTQPFIQHSFFQILKAELTMVNSLSVMGFHTSRESQGSHQSALITPSCTFPLLTYQYYVCNTLSNKLRLFIHNTHVCA